MEEYMYYVGGEFRSSKNRIEVINPANEEPFAYFYESSKEDIEYAIKCAKDAYKEWRCLDFSKRGEILADISDLILENVNTLADLETREIGKIFRESLFVDIPLSQEVFKYYASFSQTFYERFDSDKTGIDIIRYEPFGVVAVLLPYNVPFMIFGFVVPAALLAGNSVIIKPSEYGSLSILEFTKHLQKLDIPAGLINVISGRGDVVGSYLCSKDVDLISFTGSRETLKKIFSRISENPKKVVCELGGCNICVVFEDADLEEAVQNVCGSAFIKQGQMCIGTTLLLVEASIYDDFMDSLVEKIEKIELGDPFDPTVGMGPLVTKDHLLAVDEKVKNILNGFGKLIYGGRADKEKGYFYKPTVVELEEILYEEFFAPVLLAKRVKESEIETILENNPTGLVTQIWTKDLEKAKKFEKMSRSGTVWINTFARISPKTPFGGAKESGWGRNLGKEGLFEYMFAKHVGIGFEKSPISGWFGF